MENRLLFNNVFYKLVKCNYPRFITHVKNEEHAKKLENIGVQLFNNPMVYESNCINIKGEYYGLIPEENGK